MESFREFLKRKKEEDSYKEHQSEKGEAFSSVPEAEDDWIEKRADPEDAYWKDQRKKYEQGGHFFCSEDEAEWHEYLRETKATRMALELDLLDGAISFDASPPPQQLEDPAVLTSFLTKDGCIDHPTVSACAVHELSALALDKDGLFWTNDALLNQQHYQQTFPRPKWDDEANSSPWTHASRASAVVKMEHTRLAHKFTLDKDWLQLFPSIVSTSTGLRFLSPGSSSRNPDGCVLLMHMQLHAPTPFVPERDVVSLRTCKKIDHSTWVVADVSVDSSLNVGYPCGCLIQGMPDGSSQVTWVEHLEFEESYRLDPKLYSDLCSRGFAFVAERWVACLQRSCERRSYHRTKSDFYFVPRLVGQDLLDYEKKCVMRFSNRMVRDFCENIGPLGWDRPLASCVSAPRQSSALFKVKYSPYHDDPRQVVILATTTFSLPHSPEFVLKILGDERRRNELDASGRIGPLKEVACYTTGADPRNKISVQANKSFDNDLLLQEVSVSRSGSLVVWSLLRNEPFDLAKLGQNPQSYPLIGLSGIAISSQNSSNTTAGGSYVTLCLQQEAHRIKGLWPPLKQAVKECMRDTICRFEEALNNPKDKGVHGSTNKRKRETGVHGSINKRKRETGDCLF